MENKKFYPIKRYLEFYNHAISDLESFWEKEAEKIPWFKRWEKGLVWEEPFARWFVGGALNASYACVDVHMHSWRKNKVAIYWEDENGNTKTISYTQLYREVNRFASALKDIGVKKGDIVVLYLPMIPELVISMLATARIGAIHAIVFSGFSSEALADRINDTGAKVLITADFGIRRGKFVPLKEIIDSALKSTPTIEKVVLVKRTQEEINMEEGRDLLYHELLTQAENYTEPESVESSHPLYILYTSGTTGKPKGIVHSTGGYLVYNYATYKWVFDVSDESIYWCTADIGWVTGHSYIVYAPLLHGATIVMYEGAPDYPHLDRWWEIIEKYGVTIFYTSPTALRMFMRHGEEWIKRHDLSSLKILGTVGEPINPEVWEWYYRHIGGERCPIVDTWWQTETGGMMISPAPGLGPVPLKAGSTTLPLPGIDAEVVDDSGNPVATGIKGYLVIKRPWPGMLMGLYHDPVRYKEVYWTKFKGVYYTGDYAIKDEEGYFWLLGRADETLKVAGHRIGTAEVESAVVANAFVAEAAVVGVPDPIKGEAIVIFTILKDGYKPEADVKENIIDSIRKQIGALATPREIYFVEKLPKTRSGKIMRRILKAITQGVPIGDVTTLEDEASVDEIKQLYDEVHSMLKG
ncbi:MAG: acetate--CoA ligase [Nitrospinae bacterium RIFCSPLOWO2_12_FULL_45_22]|nr:MAG: acetate--CoA ligase [Nitrospinae bacterium RIFCSPLOWO2_12_FULL_45_22]